MVNGVPGFPQESTELELETAAGILRLQVDLPEELSEGGDPVGMICGPDPRSGATPRHKVVSMMARAISELGATAVRFYYRGTAAPGEHEIADDEALADARAVVGWVRQAKPHSRLWIAGYDYGANIAMRLAAERDDIEHLVLVAPAIDREDAADLPDPDCRWLLVYGSDDDIIGSALLEEWLNERHSPPQLVNINGADHEFRRHLMDLRGALKNGIRRQQR